MQAPARELEPITVDGREVVLRVFTPAKSEGPPKPAVVMVCGLLWLGDGFLGQIGLRFNDRFGYAFARSGCACVQIHTPQRHIAHTRMMELLVLVITILWPLLRVPGLRCLLLAGDVLMLATQPLEYCLAVLFLLLGLLEAFTGLLPAVLLELLGGLLALPAVHLLVRAVQWARGGVPWPAKRDYLREVAAAVAWAQERREGLGSDGRLVLCGYSSGGHVAALYGLSAEAPKFAAVVLISGIYSLRTDTWTGGRRWLAPVFHMLYEDILGAASAEARAAASPAAVAAGGAPKELRGEWYVLSARMELMGLQPFESILFDASELCAALTAKGANVRRATCGLNHWLLILNIADFVGPFCAGL